MLGLTIMVAGKWREHWSLEYGVQEGFPWDPAQHRKTFHLSSAADFLKDFKLSFLMTLLIRNAFVYLQLQNVQ